ncbi:mitotic spindle assembly checkpoint protein MAD2 [Piromyces finnis]|uniref:Mitotic spindle assembly checkpoint protein MAD2 n=1 Tax=Piromyces finnis TaxID=1754191 RepID=A0A1Y1UVA1_9FUNG|nr:mitotic spindle assembly checkpoint protein MAD2 [Piromyces finnis]|eukprot:ORX41952.1 mitotic spindle assembly checkpoint protein MAD2 [Piromyces finnis]
MTSRKNITLCGSSDIVAEFFEYCINSILFQRGIYEPEDFKMVKKYNLNLLVTSDDRVQAYISEIMEQVKKWIGSQSIKRLVLVILSKETREVMERWQFDIQIQKNVENDSISKKSESEIQSEIQAILRQLTASISFLPILEEQCTFNVLAYTDKNAEVPQTWIDSDPKYIKVNQEQVKLRSFSTPYHSVDAMVSYRFRDY